jgi:hypothetical protein
MCRVFSFVYPTEYDAWSRCPMGALGATVQRDLASDGWELRYWL